MAGALSVGSPTPTGSVPGRVHPIRHAKHRTRADVSDGPCARFENAKTVRLGPRPTGLHYGPRSGEGRRTLFRTQEVGVSAILRVRGQQSKVNGGNYSLISRGGHEASKLSSRPNAAD